MTRTGNFAASFLMIFFLLAAGFDPLFAQDEESPCPKTEVKKARKLFDKAVAEYQSRNYPEASKILKEVTEIDPLYVEPYYVLGLINVKRAEPNVKSAKKYFEKVAELCPEYDPYTFFYLGDIYFGEKAWEKAADCLQKFMTDVDRIKSDRDYNKAENLLNYARFYAGLMGNPVPFFPVPVKDISTSADEYLAIISPDNEMALFTRRMKVPPNKNELIQRETTKEVFMYSGREGDHWDSGKEMPYPFNQRNNEGGPTLTIDNSELFYTVCDNTGGYFNCDIFYSAFRSGEWSEIRNIGKSVNLPNSWDSQPSVTSDGRILYFVSDRPGGYGGYDIYKTTRDSAGNWSKPVNLGPTINTAGNEKSPFIHTDSQTLYFSSDGHMGMGGYDIFLSKMDENGKWNKPRNIGYPINTEEDEVGFFVSMDGHYGYFSSSKYAGMGGWDLYAFDLYEGAHPEKVLFLKGEIREEKSQAPMKARIELKNAETKKVTSIAVDSATGRYAAAVVFRNDFIMTIKKEGFAYESKYFSRQDTAFVGPAKVDFEIKPIEVNVSYRLNDIYFQTDSSNLNNEAKLVLEGFMEFLSENPGIKISIEGHTDDVGNDTYNLALSEKRAKSVYDYLLEKGIAGGRLSYKGWGESKPVASNLTGEGRAKNRRTVFVITSK